MVIEDQVLSGQERLGFLLRSLYASHGFERYRMSKFEEYDLYSRNRDFLLSSAVITFTDPTGRLMALKPDVTLSIVKNRRDTPGQLQKLYYHENVYRVASAEEGFREQTQVGVECMGEVDDPCIAETLRLAAESLHLCSEHFILEISHLDLLNAFVDALAPGRASKEAILACAGAKNLHGITDICRESGLAPGAEQPLLDLLSLYGVPRTVMPRVRSLAAAFGAEEMAERLGRAVAGFTGTELENRVQIDFSAVSDLRYYNGIAFRGFIDGVPDSVLSGGQYDALMRRMSRRDRAIGFAVFLDRLSGWAGLSQDQPSGKEESDRA